MPAPRTCVVYQRVSSSDQNPPREPGRPDRREQLTLIPLVVLALWIGVYPKPMFDVLRLPAEKIVAAVGGRTLPNPALARKASPVGTESSPSREAP